MTTLTEHETIELPIARRIIKNGLKAGYTISVYDGEVWTVKKSTNAREIHAALASTDSDTVRFRTADGVPVGSVLFIWGNGEEVVSDCTDKPEIDALIGQNSDGVIK